MSRFRPIDRATDILLPPAIQEWLEVSVACVGAQP